MTKHIIWQLWKNYTETSQAELLAQAVEYADFSDDWGPNKEIQKAVAEFIRQHTRNHKFETSVRNKTVRIMHDANKSQGLSAEESYRVIKNQFEEWAKLAAQERKESGEEKRDYIHVALSTEAIRKILT